MSNQNQYDDLDNFFRKYLNQSSSSEEEWSIPSDDVWERALPHFKEEKKKRGIAFWLAIGCGILGIVLATMGVVLFQMHHKINHLEEEQTIIKAQQADLSLNKNSTISEVSSNDLLEKTAIEKAFRKKINPKKTKTANAFNIKNSEKDFSNSTKNSASKLYQSQNLSLLDNSTMATEADLLTLLPPKNIELFDAEKQQELEPLVIQTGLKSIDFREVEAENALAFSKKLPKAAKYLSTKKSFANTLGFELMYFAPTLMNFSNDDAENPVLLGYNNWTWSKGLSFNVVYQFNHRWSLTSGAARSNLNKQFLAYGIENYNELNNKSFKDGHIENQVILDMFSPIGNTNETITIQSDRRRLVPHNTPVILDGSIMHHLEMVRIPIGIRYNALKFNHLQLNTEIGIGYNMVTSNNYNVSYGILLNDEIITRRDYTIELETPISNDIWDATFTLGLQQRIGNHWNWNWNVSYTQSLHKIANNVTEYEMNYWKGLKLQMGLGFTLK